MADWYGTSRSNYFHVKDEEAFRKFTDAYELDIVKQDETGAFCFLSGTEKGNIPTRWDVSEDNNQEEISIADEIHEHLVPEQVCVIMESGAEAKRHVTGYAVAIHSSGEKVEINLRDIYKEAQEAFPDSSITEAMY